jgi:hypothetical protein
LYSTCFENGNPFLKRFILKKRYIKTIVIIDEIAILVVSVKCKLNILYFSSISTANKDIKFAIYVRVYESIVEIVDFNSGDLEDFPNIMLNRKYIIKYLNKNGVLFWRKH